MKTDIDALLVVVSATSQVMTSRFAAATAVATGNRVRHNPMRWPATDAAMTFVSWTRRRSLDIKSGIARRPLD